MRRRWPVAARGVLFLAIFGCWGSPLQAATTFGNGSLYGRWAVELGPAVSFAAVAPGALCPLPTLPLTPVDPGQVADAVRQHVARVGVIDWDGSGGAEGRFIAVTDNNDGQTMTIDYTWSGTYTLNPDGTGTLTTDLISALCTPAPPEGGNCDEYVDTDTFALSMSKRYGTLALMQLSSAMGAKILLTGEAIRQSRSATPYFFTSNSLTGRWQFQFVPAMSFAALAPGDPGNVTDSLRQNVMRVGYLEFNGVGAILPGTVIANTDDIFGNPVSMRFQWLGTYTLDSDGIGRLTVNPVLDPNTACTPPSPPDVDPDCASYQSTETYAFVASKSRQRLMLIQTNNVRGAGAVMYQRGTAQRQ